MPYDGVYQIELWGASGGDTIGKIGGNGAYTSGNINLNKGQKLYVYVGSKGEDAKEWNAGTSGGWNGGATSVSSTYGIGGNTFGTGVEQKILDWCQLLLKMFGMNLIH